MKETIEKHDDKKEKLLHYYNRLSTDNVQISLLLYKARGAQLMNLSPVLIVESFALGLWVQKIFNEIFKRRMHA